MAKGIGIDMVSISETARRLASEPKRPGDIDTPNAFALRTFTASSPDALPSSALHARH